MSVNPPAFSHLQLQYPDVLNYMNKYLAQGRTESRAFLMWFLENYFRLDDSDACDAVCDGPDDKGVDGIYVDDNLEQIIVFQSRLLQSSNRTLGDTQLKEFFGTLAQFQSPETVRQLAGTTGNIELQKLLHSTKIEEKIEEGYSVQGVFVTNTLCDENAARYLANNLSIEVYDAKRLDETYVPIGPSGPRGKTVTFDLFGQDVIEYQVGETTAIFAPISATDLLQLDGLKNGELFVWNVRRSLGKTKVNKEIAESICDESEHRNFLLYHNGITILTQNLERDDNRLTISNYTVVNGAQSLTSIYENRMAVSSDLRILVRIILIAPDSELASKITHRSNNQNSINARDLQANSALQRRLQNEFTSEYGSLIFYRIQRGEESSAPMIIDNSDAALIMLAFDLKEPWTCHQKYKLFDELHSDIFARPEVTAHRVYAEQVIYNVSLDCLPKIKNEMLGKYQLTRYFMLYVLRLVLEQDQVGKQLINDPGSLLSEKDGITRIAGCVRSVTEDLIIDLDGELDERDARNEPFDYKREFKSPTSVRQLAGDVISPYQKALKRGRATSFSDEWSKSTP